MDLDAVQEQLAVLAAVTPEASRGERVLRELDRLAELLVGQTEHGVPAIKLRIQELIVMVGRKQTAVAMYIEVYCR